MFTYLQSFKRGRSQFTYNILNEYDYEPNDT